MKQLRIISFGEVLWDLFPEGEKFGGAPANFACHAAIQGADVSMVSAVGDDSRGHEAIRILRGYGVDVGFLQTVADAPTGTVGVELDDVGKPTFTIQDDAAWDHLVWDDKLTTRIAAADAIYFGTLGQRGDISRAVIRRAVQVAKDAGVPRVCDINIRRPFFDSELIRESVQLASILKLSNDELDTVCAAFDIGDTNDPESLMRSLSRTGGLDMVVMSCGAEGALLVTPEVTIRQSGTPVEVTDTVGAGDAFTAAFLIGVLTNQSMDKSLLNACQIAAATCAHSGAIPDTRKKGTPK